MRFFNTAGPTNCTDHYCLPPLSRFNIPEISALIAQQKYFLLHAPRQTGKTSCLLALMDYLNQSGQYRALYANVENAQAAREDVEQGLTTIVWAIASNARWLLEDTVAEPLAKAVLQDQPAANALQGFLTAWCEQHPQPTVLLLDEVDALVGDTLISLLRQLRAGYTNRPAHFPQSLILCGVRDLHDYRIHSSRDKTVITGGSAFNIKAVSLRLGDFSRADVETLLAEHTHDTGQPFTPEAVATVWDLTSGQPWLVNALAYEATFTMPSGHDRSLPITAEMIQQAKENLIARRETHLDQLADKLREPRIRRVVEALLSGEQVAAVIPTDDIDYARDLGLIRVEGQLSIANRIYQEIIPRELTYSTQLTIPEQPAWYILPDGRLDMPKLLTAFQQFFRENSEIWLERFDYKEAGPQLLMQAFLQRIINGGGRVDREYGLGRRSTDLFILWPTQNRESRIESRESPLAAQRIVLELKILRKGIAATLTEGLAQTWDYVDKCGADEAHLLIFDRTPDKAWEEKLYRREETYKGHTITVWGM